MDAKILGGRLRRLRMARGFTQQTLADLMGIRTDRLSRIESGDRTITVTEFANWAEACGVTTDDILSGASITVELGGTAEAAS